MSEEKPSEKPLEIRTLVFVRAVSSGEVLCAPLADGSLASVAREDEALLEQKLGLADHLGTADPETIARFSFPAGTELRITDVVIPRDDLPKKLAIRTPISIPTAVVPAGQTTVTRPREGEVRVRSDAWLMILPLGYTGYVAVDERFSTEDLDEADIAMEVEARVSGAIEQRIRDEVRRLWLARDEGPAAFLSLLPSMRQSLAAVDVELARGERSPGARAASLRKALVDAERKKRAVAVLDSVAQPVHLRRKRYVGAPPPLVGREDELALLSSLLSSKKDGERASALLVGKDRVGKSALLHAYIDGELAAGRAPVVYATSGAALIAGMSGLGQWQERVRRVMQAAADVGAVMWFDDLADLFTERGRSSIDVPSALRPWIEQGKVHLIGEIDDDRLERVERRNVGFFAALARIRVPALDVARTLAVLRARVRWDRTLSRTGEPNAPTLADDALAPLVDLAERYLPYESFPGKAVRLYEELRAMHAGSTPARSIGQDAMFEAASLRTGVPAFLLREDRPLLLEDVDAALRARVIGQDEAVRRVAETVCVIKAGLQPRDKPLATFLFVGPTGVGKTELARALAEFLFGQSPGGMSREGGRMTRFDMSEYMDPLAADRLIRGSAEGEGALTRKVREQPFCVLLLDEIEKAHPSVFDLLLQVCGEGRLTDAAGRTAHFHNAIIIMTSNLGAADRRPPPGFKSGFDRPETADASHYQRAVNAAFRPEMLNRIDRVIAFVDLGPSHRRALVEMAVEKVQRRRGLVEPGCGLTVSEAALDALGDEGYSAAYGARALRRHVEAKLVSAIARATSAYTDPEQVDVDVRLEREPEAQGAVAKHEISGLRVALVKRGTTKPQHEFVSMREISAVRRDLARWSRLDRVLELREQSKFLVAQLGTIAPSGGREARDHGKLQADLHRLTTLLAALDDAHALAQTVEDQALEAFFRGETVAHLRRDALDARGSFVKPFVAALVAAEPKRDEITIIAQELDDGLSLGWWLGGLLAIAQARRWTIQVHVDRDARDDVPSWPADRRWGPPRTPATITERLEARGRDPLAVLIKVEGPDAILLALEAGLLRVSGGREGGKDAHLFVQLVALRTTFADALWASLDPDPPGAFAERTKVPTTRSIDPTAGKITVSTRRTIDLPHAQYWPRLDELHMHQLLLCEEGKLDRDDLLRGRLPHEEDELRMLLRTEGKIAAIRRYRELSGSSLRDAKDAIDAMAAEMDDG